MVKKLTMGLPGTMNRLKKKKKLPEQHGTLSSQKSLPEKQ